MFLGGTYDGLVGSENNRFSVFIRSVAVNKENTSEAAIM